MFLFHYLKSFWKSPESVEDRLIILDEKIKKLENLKSSDLTTQRNLIFKFFLYSFLVYASFMIFIYLFYWPESAFKRFLCLSSILVYPLLLIALRHVLRIYFLRRVSYKDARLRELRKEKQKIIDAVKETQTFNKAQQILSRFEAMPSTTKESSNSNEVRQRALANKQESQSNLNHLKTNNLLKEQIQEKAKPVNQFQLPRPILPRERSVLEKMIDTFVGDGPNNRYALICKNCYSHNGMALAEEFEFLAFKCCYCKEFNPARRKRSVAPTPSNVDSFSEPLERSQIKEIKVTPVTNTNKDD